MSQAIQQGAVLGVPKLVLRLEGLTVFALSIWLFGVQGEQWWLYPVLLLVPDVFMLGYLRNTKLGSISYNVGHAYPLAAILIAGGFVFGSSLSVALGAIWFGHIGCYRMLGYGLKYGTSFKHTHLGDLNKPKSSTAGAPRTEHPPGPESADRRGLRYFGQATFPFRVPIPDLRINAKMPSRKERAF